MYKNSKYSSAKDDVNAIATDKKANASNRKRARKLLGLAEEDEEEKSEKGKSNEKSEKSSEKKANENLKKSSGQAK